MTRAIYFDYDGALDDLLSLTLLTRYRGISLRGVTVTPADCLIQPAVSATRKILELAKRHGIWVVEDCAQAAGASYRGRPVGSMGDLGAFSLQTNKIITTGDGGAVTTHSRHLWERALRSHDQGSLRGEGGQPAIDTSGEAFFGQNFRMNELTGAVALAQVRKLPAIVEAMRQCKAVLRREL